MEVIESQIHQVFVKLLDGKHRILNFDAPSISVSALKHHIQTLTAVPSHLLLLISNSRILHDHCIPLILFSGIIPTQLKTAKATIIHKRRRNWDLHAINHSTPPSNS